MFLKHDNKTRYLYFHLDFILLSLIYFNYTFKISVPTITYYKA